MIAAKGVVVDALLAAVPEITAGTGRAPDRPGVRRRASCPRRRRAVSWSRCRSRRAAGAELRYLDDGHPERVIDAYHPDYVKVLIRYNPGGDTAMNARQRARLRDLATLLDGRPERSCSSCSCRRRTLSSRRWRATAAGSTASSGRR